MAKKILLLLIVSLIGVVITTLCVWLGWDLFLRLAFNSVPEISFLQALWLTLAISFISSPAVYQVNQKKRRS